VSIRYEGDDDVERYLIGSIEERHDDLDVISPSSPLGEALIGASPGDTVSFTAPTGAELQVEVVAID
jgi:transcription elongation factor GreA